MDSKTFMTLFLTIGIPVIITVTVLIPYWKKIQDESDDEDTSTEDEDKQK